jgi:hypothetical protein
MLNPIKTFSRFKKVFFFAKNYKRHLGVNSSLDANYGVANRNVLSHGLLKILGIELRGVIVDVYHVDSNLKKLSKLAENQFSNTS